MRIVVGLLLLAGCDQLFGIDTVPLHDAALVDMPSSDAGQECIGGVLFEVCYDPATVPTTFPGSAIDTSTAAQCTQMRAGTPPVCIVIAKQIDIETSLRIVGPNPVAIVSASDLRIAAGGIIDVSSGGGTIPSPGAGADTGPCTTADGETQVVTANHAGGGAGGSFGGNGGDGGIGESTSARAQPAPVDESNLHGGCPGGRGGAKGVAQKARGGHGGGAVYVVAKGAILIDGRINANAERGYGGTATLNNEFPGGGGGGAGGMIVIDADMVAVNMAASLVANGGGGGGGADGTMKGLDGNDGAAAGAGGGTGGGSGMSIGGAGGTGSSRNMPAGTPGQPGGALQGGGGGGGGGAGYIHIYGAHSKAVSPSANVSPNPS
ncbi:MAG: hypothetical protein JO257_32915 [Deltaproteobacteria bacterium]|nr:hypothetical protein [Deltaproteobacteria bacterium]